jgi:hypothetical protein
LDVGPRIADIVLGLVLAGLTTIRDDEGQADGRDEEQGS